LKYNFRFQKKIKNVLKSEILIRINRIVLLKETEVHTSVFPVFGETGVTCEIICPWVLKDKKTILFNGTRMQYEVGEAGEPCQVIRRIGKYDIILFMTCLQEVAYIKPVNAGIAYFKTTDRFADEFAVAAVNLNEINICCTP